MSVKDYIWACDPIGSVLFISSSTLILLALDWAAGTYPWSDAHVVAPLVIGCVLLIIFGLYGKHPHRHPHRQPHLTSPTEWKARSDGLVAHVFFRSGPNFPLSVFAFAVEGWIFYSAVNAITPQMILRLGWESDSWRIAVRQLSYLLPIFFFSIPITWYSTRYKDLRSPLLLCFVVFLVLTICYACIQPSWDAAQQGLNVLSALGQAGPLTLLVAAVQFTAPHAFLSTATGLAFSARAIGGAVGSAVLDAIVAGHVGAKYDAAIVRAAEGAGISAQAASGIVAAMAEGEGVTSVAGLQPVVQGVSGEQLRAVVRAGYGVWAGAYRLAWASIVPFVVVACVCVAFLRGVRELMTEKVEATVERVGRGDEEGKAVGGGE